MNLNREKFQRRASNEKEQAHKKTLQIRHQLDGCGVAHSFRVYHADDFLRDEQPLLVDIPRDRQEGKELKKLEAELTREKTRWDEMKVPERLGRALTKFGLEMEVPREDQIVRMNRAGVPAPGQLALRRMQGASGSRSVASNASYSRSNRSVPASSSRRRVRNGVR